MSRRAKPGAEIQLTGDRAAARAVAAAREAFNTALAERDFAAIESVLAEDAVLTPGDDAVLISGRAAQLDAWRSIFTDALNVAYVRTPLRIDGGEDGLLAAETGRWRGAWSAHGVDVRYSGRYFAKWRREDDGWRIAAEVFVTLRRE